MAPVSFAESAASHDAGHPGRRQAWRTMRTKSSTLVRLLIATMVVSTGAEIVKHMMLLGRAATDENPLDAHLRAARRAQDDARRCSTELRPLAARYPGTTAWALEIEPALIAQAREQEGLAALAMRTVELRVAAVESAAQEVARLRATATPSGVAHVLAAGDLSGRAHLMAGRLCEAREAVSAATLTSPLPTRAQVSGMNAAR